MSTEFSQSLNDKKLNPNDYNSVIVALMWRGTLTPHEVVKNCETDATTVRVLQRQIVPKTISDGFAVRLRSLNADLLSRT